MSKYQCHYECLKVTRDAPAEVIRAAYRSLSQKHHPDKNVGDNEAVRVMARLNYAYSVLSDPAQRALYDAQLMHDLHAHYGAAAHADVVAPRAGSERTLLNQFSLYAIGRKGRITAVVTFVLLIGGGVMVQSIWKEQRSMRLLEQAALPAAGSDGIATSQAPAHVVATPRAPGADANVGAVEPQTPSPAPAAPVAVAKTNEFERLTVLLKSMGLGLHKLDVPAQAPGAKRPAPPTQPVEPDKSVAAGTAAAPPARPQASTAVVPPETARPREEAERTAAPEAGRANLPQAPVASAPGAAVRQAVIADARACAPSYPARAYSNGESGTVQLALLVGGDGGVLESKVQKSSGHPELDKAARKALSQCHFKVAGNDRSAEPVWANVEYAFSLD